MPEWLIVIAAIVAVFLIGLIFSKVELIQDIGKTISISLFVFLMILLTNRYLTPHTGNGSDASKNFPNENLALSLLTQTFILIILFYSVQKLYLIYMKLVRNKIREEQCLRGTIVTLKLLDREIWRAILTTCLSMITTVSYMSANSLFNFKLSITPYYLWLIVTLIITFTWLRIVCLNYRINKGYYGNNLYEAREVINFIEQVFGKLPPGGGDGQFKAFPDIEESANISWIDDLAGEGNQ